MLQGHHKNISNIEGAAKEGKGRNMMDDLKSKGDKEHANGSDIRIIKSKRRVNRISVSSEMVSEMAECEQESSTSTSSSRWALQRIHSCLPPDTHLMWLDLQHWRSVRQWHL